MLDSATPGLVVPGLGTQKPKQNLTSEFATRRISIDFYSLNLYLPNPDPVLKKTGKDLRVYRDLTSFGRVWSGITSRKAGVMSLEWEIDRGKAKSSQAREIDAVFKSLDLERIFSEILDAVLYGFQPLEVIWEKRPNGLILPVDVVGKPQEWFTFGPKINELRLRTKWNWINGEEVIDRKFLLARNYATYRNPYGESVLSRCFWPVAFARGGWKFWTVFAEKYGMPWLIGKHTPGAEQGEITRIADMLENMVQDAIAVIPDNASVEVVEAANKAANADFYRGMVQEAKSEISEVLVGHAGAAESTPGKLGNETAALAVRQDIVESDRKLVEQTLNQLIDWIYELNWGEGERPRFGMFSEEQVDLTLAQRDGELASKCGVRFTSAYLQRAYGFEAGDLVVDDKSAEPLNRGKVESTRAATGKGALTTIREEESARKQSAQFSEATGAQRTTPTFPDQELIDLFAESFSPAELQAIMKPVITPVLQAIEQGGDLTDMMSALAGLFPQMETSALQKLLTRLIFVAEVWGRISAQEEQV
jgi:phage gp29-like protein